MLRWARAFGVQMAPELIGYFERVAERETVRRALAEEGLVEPLTSIDSSSDALT